MQAELNDFIKENAFTIDTYNDSFRDSIVLTNNLILLNGKIKTPREELLIKIGEAYCVQRDAVEHGCIELTKEKEYYQQLKELE